MKKHKKKLTFPEGAESFDKEGWHEKPCWLQKGFWRLQVAPLLLLAVSATKAADGDGNQFWHPMA